MYTAGNEGPVVFCLHGGGYSGYDLLFFFCSYLSVSSDTAFCGKSFNLQFFLFAENRAELCFSRV